MGGIGSTITGALASTANKFGGDVMNIVQQWLSGINVAATDPNNKPQIDTDTRIRSKRLRFQDASTPTRREIDWEVANQSADRTVQVPALSNATQKLVLELEALRLKNKILDAADANTFANIPQSSIVGLSNVLTSASHVGTGSGKIAKSSTGGLLTLKSVKSGSNVNVVNETDDITINATPSSIGGFLPIAVDVPSATQTGLSYLSLAGGDANTTLTNRTIEIGMDMQITAVRARVQTNSTNGSGLEFGFVDDGVIVEKVAVPAGTTGYFEFNVSPPRLVQAGSMVAISINHLGSSGTYEARPIVIDVSSGTFAGVNDVANVGTGQGLVFKDKVANVANLKRLLAGSNVTITNGTNDITIAASGNIVHKSSHVSGGLDAFVKGDVLVARSRYVEDVADPGSDSNRIWVSAGTKNLKYWDNQAIPVKHTVEVFDSRNVSNGYAGLDVNGRIQKAQQNPETIYGDLTTPNISQIGWFNNRHATAHGGVLNGICVSDGTYSQQSGGNGLWARYTSGGASGDKAGVRTNVILVERIHQPAPKLEIVFSIGNSDFQKAFIGWVAETGAFLSGADPLNAKIGVGLWIDLAVSGNLRKARNDGSGATTIDDYVPVTAVGTGGHTFVLTADEANSRWTFQVDGQTVNFASADIPASGSEMALMIYTETATTAARRIDIFRGAVRCGSG